MISGLLHWENLLWWSKITKTQNAQARVGEEKTLYLYYTANIVPNQSWLLIGEVSLWLGYCCSVELNSKYNGWLFISTMLICFCGINKYAKVSLGINKPFFGHSKATVTVGVNVKLRNVYLTSLYKGILKKKTKNKENISIQRDYSLL